MCPTTVVFSDPAEGNVSGGSTTYATARSTAIAFDSADTMTVGQFFGSPNYACYEGFTGFDTSAITGTVTSAILSLTDAADNSTTNFTIEVRLYDWGTTVDIGDYIAGASLGGQTLLATYAVVNGWTGNTYKDFVDVAMAANINQSGFTRFVLCSDRMRLGTTPTNAEFVIAYGAEQGGTTVDPKLTIITTAVPAAVLSGTATASITESDVVAGGKTIILTLTDSTWVPA